MLRLLIDNDLLDIKDRALWAVVHQLNFSEEVEADSYIQFKISSQPISYYWFKNPEKFEEVIRES
jgi:hypothetical protein